MCLLNRGTLSNTQTSLSEVQRRSSVSAARNTQRQPASVAEEEPETEHASENTNTAPRTATGEQRPFAILNESEWREVGAATVSVTVKRALRHTRTWHEDAATQRGFLLENDVENKSIPFLWQEAMSRTGSHKSRRSLNAMTSNSVRRSLDDSKLR